MYLSLSIYLFIYLLLWCAAAVGVGSSQEQSAPATYQALLWPEPTSRALLSLWVTLPTEVWSQGVSLLLNDPPVC